MVEHQAFRDLWDEALADPEYEGVEREGLGDVHPGTTVIAVEPERLQYDIAIPQLSRLLTRQAGALEALRVQDLPARHLRLPQTLRAEAVEYRGRDLLSGEEVDRARYPLDQQQDPGAVLAWFVAELQRRTRLTGQFAVLAPLVKGWVEEKAFGGPVDFADPLVLQSLAEAAAQETVLTVLTTAVDQATLETRDVVAEPAKELLLSATRPFLWSGEVATATRSVFSAQPCDSGLEVQFCGFLDRCSDVEAFAKLAREVRFSLEYRGEGGRLAYYYPDFVVRLSSGEHLVVETKGRVDLDVPAKDERARRWAVDASLTSGMLWRYLRVDQDLFEAKASTVTTLGELAGAVDALARDRLLGTLDQLPTAASRGEAATRVAALRARLQGMDGADEELRRFRDDPA